MTEILQDIADTADELTDPRQHVERIHDRDTEHRNKRLTRVWITTMPSLLDQLAEAVIPGESYVEEESTRQGFGPRPPARLDAVDRLLAIEAGAARWCVSLRMVLRDTAAENIRGLVGAAGTMDSDTRTTLLSELKAWRSWAATVTGWERPPDAPRAPCPNCDAHGSLRVRLDRKTGCCMQCGAGWDDATIGLLAEHVTRHLARSTKAARAASLADLLTRRLGEHVVRVKINGADPVPALLTVVAEPLIDWQLELVVEEWPHGYVVTPHTVEIIDLLVIHLHGYALATAITAKGDETYVRLLGARPLVRRAEELEQLDKMSVSNARSA